MPLSIGIGIAAALGKGVGVQPLRQVATTAHVLNNVQASAGCDSIITRCPFVIGRDTNSLWLSFQAWVSATGTTNAFTIQKLSIEKGDGSLTVPVTFSAGRTKVFSGGEDDVQTDEIKASSFGLSKFTRGEQYFWRIDVLATLAAAIPTSDALGNGGKTYLFPSANRIDQVDSTGALSAPTGSSDVSSTSQTFSPALILGHPLDHLPSIMVLGDSIANTTTDNRNPPQTVAGAGYTARGAVGGADLTTALAFSRFCRSGSKVADWAGNTHLANYWKYFNVLFCELIVNDIDPAIGSPVMATVEANWLGFVTAARAAGVQKVVGAKPTPRTTSTSGNWTSAVDQTYATNNGPAASSATFNAWLDARLADSTIDAIFSSIAARDGGGDFYKWITDGLNKDTTQDGLHPNVSIHITLAAEYRAAMLALSVS